jgi:iron complex outermembrane receptor protein
MDHYKPHARLATLLGVCISASVSGVALAQQAGANGSEALEEVVITAQKYSENLQKAPVAVTAVTGETLQTLGITSAEDLTQVVPNLVVGQTGSSAQVGIRGAIDTSIGDQGDPAVAFNVDGVYLARARSALTALYDIDRIEVLRGPQGTLYGRNSINGTINVITNKPDLDATALSGAVQYGNYNEMLTFGMLNLPVSSTFGLRGAFQSERHDGYSHNWPARDSNDLDAITGRVEGLWKPNDSFSALLSLSDFHNGGVGGGSFNGGAPTGLYTQATGFTPYNYQEAPGEQYADELARDATLTLDWKLPYFTVTYVGNVRYDSYAGASTTGVNGPLVLVFRNLPEDNFGGVCATYDDPSCTNLRLLSQSHQASHELRLSNETDRLKWVLGFYYFRENDAEYGAVDPCPCSPNVGITFNYPGIQNATHAVFGQATWSLTQSLRIMGGVRYNNDFKGQTGNLFVGPIGNVVGVGPNDCPLCDPANPTAVDYSSMHFRKVTWKAGADMDLTPDSLLFFSVATGYKDGGFGDGVQPNNSSFLPENMLDYELGTKNQLFNHRLQINANVFHEIYSNFQSTASQFVNGRASPYTVNAGKATIDGIELETAALVTPLDRLGINATLLHAHYTSFFLPFGDEFNANQPEDLKSKNLAYTPRETIRLSYAHTFPMASGASIVPRIDTGYVAAQDLDYHNYPAAHQPSYTRTELSLTYNAPKYWSVQAWVRNLENKAVLVSQQLDNSVPNGVVNGVFDPTAPNYEGKVGKDGFYLAPRTFGIKLSAHL